MAFSGNTDRLPGEGWLEKDFMYKERVCSSLVIQTPGTRELSLKKKKVPPLQIAFQAAAQNAVWGTEKMGFDPVQAEEETELTSSQWVF